VVQAGDRTRVVLNLKQPTAYKAQLQGKSLLVVLDTVALPRRCAAGAGFAESRNRDTCRSRTWTSAVVPKAPGASWWRCPTTRSASTSVCRARTWWSSS
jgi:hypothetical protein